MNITDYKKLKAADTKNKTHNVTVKLINSTPALVCKTYDPDTGTLLPNEMQAPIDIPALQAQVVTWQAAIDNVNELIADAEALKPVVAPITVPKE